MSKYIRILVLAIMGIALVALPGQALGRGHKRHPHRHRGHKRAPHSPRARVREFHAVSGPVATVASFTDGKLTINLTDGSAVSGRVTSRTEIECMAPSSTSPGAMPSTRRHGSDSEHSGAGTSSAASSDEGARPTERPETPEGAEVGEPNEAAENEAAETPAERAAEASEHAAEPERCGTDALKPGIPVAEAKLRIGRGGSTFEKVELGS